MPTNAEYMTLVGDNRIVSLINDTGAGVAVPKTLENTLYSPREPGDDQPGNRKIIIKMRIGPIWDDQELLPENAEDSDFILKVEVPKGIITGPGVHTGNAVQEFAYNTPPETHDTPLLSYFPMAYAIPQNETCYPELLFATPVINSPDEDAQTVDILIRQANLAAPYYAPIVPAPPAPPVFPNYMLFYVVVDWSYSASR